MESATIMSGPASGAPSWRVTPARYRAEIYLSQPALQAAELVEPSLGGFAINSTMLDAGMPIPVELISSAHAIVVEVRCEQGSSMERLQRLLADAGSIAVIAVVLDPSVSDMRRLMRTGVADILPLPLKIAEFGPSLERLGAELDRRTTQSRPAGKTICAIKSRGGVGATTILTQVGCLLASTGQGGEACLIDLDLQYGDAAFCLGSLPALNLKDLIDAGNRLDQSLLRATLKKHQSGLSYLAAPHEILPLDILSQEQAATILDLAAREFGTLFVDLPHDWTNWSLTVAAQADLIFLVCDLSLPSLRRAKRQLDFLRENDLTGVPLQVVLNKVEKGRFKSVRFEDAEKILGRPVAFSIAGDPETVRGALNQGNLVEDIDRRSRVARDLRVLAEAVAEQPALMR